MKYKTPIILLLAFAGLSLTADYVVTRVGIHGNPSGDAGRLYHLFVEPAGEIPIFGSSKAYDDYIPDEMGVNAFNYGLNGASYDVTDAFLQIELAKPKTTPVIIDLKPESEQGLGDPSTYAPYVFDSRIRGMMQRSGQMSWRFRVPGIRYFGYYDYYLKEWINDRWHLTQKVVRGFSYKKDWAFDRARLDFAIRERTAGTNGYFPDEDQNRRLVAQIKAHPNRLFFLVYSPYHSSCFVNFQNLGQFNAFKAELAALPNAVVLDFARMNLPDEDFKDSNHLLYGGALEFSRALGASINEVLHQRGNPAPGLKTALPVSGA